jgi:hypothetical protein
MWGFNPRISAWSNAVPMCPPACTNPSAQTALRYCGVDWPSHINVVRLSRKAPRSRLRAETTSPGALSALKRLFD